MSEYENYLAYLQSNALSEEKRAEPEIEDDTIVKALEKLELKKASAIETKKETEKLEKFVPEPIHKVVHEEIDPVYGGRTQTIREKAIFLQKKMDEANQLTRWINKEIYRYTVRARNILNV